MVMTYKEKEETVMKEKKPDMMRLKRHTFNT
jgi:hypothetical protein